MRQLLVTLHRTGRPSVNAWRYPAFISFSTTKRLGVWTNFSACGSS